MMIISVFRTEEKGQKKNRKRKEQYEEKEIEEV